MRADCIHRDSQRPGNLRSGLPLQPHCVNGFLFLLFHLDNSSFEFAVLCVIALARCPPYGPQDTTRPWPIPLETYANSCISSVGAVRRGVATDDLGPTPSFVSQCVATCSKYFGIISINRFYRDNSLFPATSCYKLYADKNSDALTRYPRSSVVAPPPRLGRLRTTVANPRRAWLKLRLFSGWQPFSEHQLR